MATTEKLKWFCEGCKVRGEIEYEQHADVMTVVHLVGDSHRHASPNCHNPTARVRILNEPAATEADWALFNSMTPAAV